MLSPPSPALTLAGRAWLTWQGSSSSRRAALWLLAFEDPPKARQAVGDDGPPHPPAPSLAGQESRLGEDPGVMADGGLRLAQWLLEGPATAMGWVTLVEVV